MKSCFLKITLFSSFNKDTYLFRMVPFNNLNKTQLRVKPIRVCVITCCVRRIKFAWTDTNTVFISQQFFLVLVFILCQVQARGIWWIFLASLKFRGFTLKVMLWSIFTMRSISWGYFFTNLFCNLFLDINNCAPHCYSLSIFFINVFRYDSK